MRLCKLNHVPSVYIDKKSIHTITSTASSIHFHKEGVAYKRFLWRPTCWRRVGDVRVVGCSLPVKGCHHYPHHHLILKNHNYVTTLVKTHSHQQIPGHDILHHHSTAMKYCDQKPRIPPQQFCGPTWFQKTVMKSSLNYQTHRRGISTQPLFQSLIILIFFFFWLYSWAIRRD